MCIAEHEENDQLLSAEQFAANIERLREDITDLQDKFNADEKAKRKKVRDMESRIK